MNASQRIRRLAFEAYKYAIGSRIAANRLKHTADSYGNDVEKLVDVAFTFGYKQRIGKTWEVNIKPLQAKSEITDLCKIVQKSNPEVIVEIGTASGGTLFLFANTSTAKRIISIDLPGGSFGGGYPFWKIAFFKSLGKKNVIKLIRANSHDKETVLRLERLLSGQRIDFLFIDGDHTYEGVKQDFEMYAPLVREGGMVAFHDIVTHDPKVGCHVDKFWQEIKQSYEHKEFIEDKNQKWAGIGALFI